MRVLLEYLDNLIIYILSIWAKYSVSLLLIQDLLCWHRPCVGTCVLALKTLDKKPVGAAIKTFIWFSVKRLTVLKIVCDLPQPGFQS
jgi:outer membrane lipoprotein-sorting protein